MKIKATVDEVAKTELELYADNESKLYPGKLNIIKRIKHALKNNAYNADKFKKYWAAWLRLAADKYVKDFASKGASSFDMFDKDTVAALAAEYEKHEKEAVERGEYNVVSALEAEVKADMEEIHTDEVEGVPVEAKVVSYALTGQKLYAGFVAGEEITAKTADPKKAIALAKTMILSEVERTTEAVLADLLEAFKLDPESEEAAEFAATLEYEDGHPKGKFTFKDDDYEFILSEDLAISLAEEDLVEMWRSDSGTQGQFLDSYYTMTPTDMNIVAGEEADIYVENLSPREAVEEAGMQDEFDAAEEAEQDTDPIVEVAKAKVLSDKHDEIKKDLEKNPVQYFKNLGYDMDSIKKLTIFHVDYEDAAEDAVAIDGWEHTLSRYDGNYETTKNGIVYFRES